MVRMSNVRLDEIQKDFSDRKILMGKYFPNHPNECTLLCVWKEYEFVTWNVCKSSITNKWSFSAGHYFEDLKEALSDFYKR